jgi:hypothetical protein
MNTPSGGTPQLHLGQIGWSGFGFYTNYAQNADATVFDNYMYGDSGQYYWQWKQDSESILGSIDPATEYHKVEGAVCGNAYVEQSGVDDEYYITHNLIADASTSVDYETEEEYGAAHAISYLIDDYLAPPCTP